MCCKTVEGVQYALENGRMDHWKPAWMSEEVVGMGTNPTWQPSKKNISLFCSGELDSKFRIAIYSKPLGGHP